MFRRTLLAVVAGAFVATLDTGAQAQAYPNKPVRLIIASSTGGGTDGIGRVVADALSVILKQPVVPDNKPGASGQIGSDLLVKSPPDGYTIMITQNGHTTNPALFKKLPYDTFRDFTPIAPLAYSPLVLVASSASNVKTLKELVELGKRDPKAMNFASAESSIRLAVEQLGEATGLKLQQLSYKGTGPAVTDVGGGHVNFAVTTMASVLPFRGTGKMNFVGVLANERSPFLPDVPTLSEQGFPGIEVRGWWGIFGPANLPPAIVQQLNGAIRTALQMPEVKQKIGNFQATPWLGTPADFDAFIRKEVPTIQQLAKKAGIEPE
ncbi:MAG TPA: tripartite tricarboxylate transporter substrate binding protein [Ramlibacter sp.]|nr:tripartite tricarboxylate transporter substrate binding protein [Ramlibacter sp.]